MEAHYAPIALFTYNRPEHTRLTLEALSKNPEFIDSPLFIYSDGAKKSSKNSLVIEATRELIYNWDHPNKIVIVREENWGLARSIIAGVTQLCEEYGKVVVVEDDLVTSSSFLRYMNDALDLYENDDRVISINGYCFPIDGLPETFFLNATGCWGWATWKRGWDIFEPNGKLLISKIEEKKAFHRFDLYGSFPYKKMLEDQIRGENDSWAVRWHASAFLQNKLTLHSGKSLVFNIGFDGTGTHSSSHGRYDSDISHEPVHVGGAEVAENDEVLSAWQVYFKKSKPSIYMRLVNKIRDMIKKVR
jgi:hypothetical protein